MKTAKDKLLLMAGADTKTALTESLRELFDLEILEAETEKKAFELIYTHFFILVMVDETLPHIDLYKIGAMLMSHWQTIIHPYSSLPIPVRRNNFFPILRPLKSTIW